MTRTKTDFILSSFDDIYLCQVLAVFGADEQVLQLLQGTARAGLEVNTHGVLGGALGILALLQHSGEALLVGGGHDSQGLLVHDAAVAVRAHAGQVVWLLERCILN